MTSIETVSAAVLAILLLPGPGNTLLATAAATAPLRRTGLFLLIETLTYIVVISGYRFALGTIMSHSPLLSDALQMGAGLYLLRAAHRLWHRGVRSGNGLPPITARQIVVTTTLNPKAALIALGILPHASNWTTARQLLCIGIDRGRTMDRRRRTRAAITARLGWHDSFRACRIDRTRLLRDAPDQCAGYACSARFVALILQTLRRDERNAVGLGFQAKPLTKVVWDCMS